MKESIRSVTEGSYVERSISKKEEKDIRGMEEKLGRMEQKARDMVREEHPVIMPQIKEVLNAGGVFHETESNIQEAAFDIAKRIEKSGRFYDTELIKYMIKEALRLKKEQTH